MSNLRQPDGYAYRYHDCIRFNDGQEVNGGKPIEAIPYFFGVAASPGTQGVVLTDLDIRFLRIVQEDYAKRAHDLANEHFQGMADRMENILDTLAGVVLINQQNIEAVNEHLAGAGIRVEINPAALHPSGQGAPAKEKKPQ